MRDEYDIVVVGAGPGGSVAARTAAEVCDVLLIEKRQEIGAPVRCAEAVFKNMLSGLIRPDRKWIVSDIHGCRIFAPDGTMLEISAEAMGIEGELAYILERKIFDQGLAKDAARAGAHLTVRTRATGLIVEDGVVKGVKINRFGEELEVRSKVVIGADGVESQVGRWGGINAALKLKNVGSCVQYLMANIDVPEDISDFYVGSVALGGYAWIFPKGDGLANVGLGMPGSKLDEKRPIDYLNEFVSRRFPDGQQLGLVMGGVPLSDQPKTMTGHGLMLVGDAARHSDPITGSGITNAMEGGRIAGTVATKAVQHDDASRDALKEYDAMWRGSLFGKLQGHSYKIKELLGTLSDDELNRLMRSLKGVKLQEMNVADITKRLLTANLKVLLIMRHVAHLRELADALSERP